MTPLAVWIEGERVGTVTVAEGSWTFRYSADWLARSDSYPISPHLPLSPEDKRDSADARSVQWFFDNLLPEGGVREALARHARLDPGDTFGMLSRFGEESAGALTLLPEEQPYPEPGRYHPLSTEDLRALLHDLPDAPLIAAGGRARMSLAGVQHKLGLHQRGEQLLLPERAASSVVVKPDNARAELFPCCPANEHFCAALAREVGLAVPRTWLLHLPEPLYVVERFDRRVVADGGGDRVARRHQLDLCQLLDKWAGYKYESDGGVTFVEAYRALDATRQPAVSRNQLLRWLIFNYLIGNSDAHAKNVAFLLDAEGLTLAPAYDLLSVAAYGADYDYLAMTIAEEVRYGWVEPDHWARLARAVGVPPAFVVRLRRELGGRVPEVAHALLAAEASFTAEERELLGRVVAVVERHAGYLLGR